MLRIPARTLATMIAEAKPAATPKTLEDRLRTQTDEQLRGLIQMCDKVLRERQAEEKRSSIKTPHDAAAFLIDVATGDAEHDDDKVEHAGNVLAATSKGATKRVAQLLDLVGSMSNTAWMLFHNEFDDDEEALDAEAQQEKDYGKLQKLLSGFGLKFNKKGMLTR